MPAVRLAPFLAGRMLRRRSSPLLRTTALAGLAAVALGVASLLVSLALMTGYQDALEEGLLGAGGHLLAYSPPGSEEQDHDELRERLFRLPGVAGVGKVVYLAGLAVAVGPADGIAVTVKGTEVLPTFAQLPEATPGQPLPVALGAGAARRLGIDAGGLISLQVASDRRLPRSVPARVDVVFSTGFSEVDESWVVAHYPELASRMPGLQALAVEIWLDNPREAEKGRVAVENAWGGPVLVSTWEDRNPGFFAALRWQKLSLAVVLSLVLGVGAFEVASALVVLVTEKRHEIGIIMAVGGDPGLTRRVLLMVGLWLGGAGVALGVALGFGVIALLRVLGQPSFPPEIAAIYLVDHIPLRLAGVELAAVVVLGMVEVLVAAWFPARRVSRRQPVEVLRWV